MHSDTRVVEWASISYVKEVIEAGVKVYLYQAGFNHSKFLVSDDSICTCGSTNVDFRSFEHDFEANVFFYDEGLALRMKKMFLDDEAVSPLATEVYAKTPSRSASDCGQVLSGFLARSYDFFRNFAYQR